jgi:signal transduction histidine kinase
MATVTVAAIAIAYGLHRYRLKQILQVERLRLRIATDLHDDIGAGLSRVAILSEAVKTRMPGDNTETVPLLSEIANSARDLVGSMRDVVWAIDPRYESLADVVTRVRQFASVVLNASQVHWQFKTAGDDHKTRLNPEQRRHILLFFKEAINNIARHAHCRNVHLEIRLDGTDLTCEAQDDGQGLPAHGDHSVTSGDGCGLRNMNARAAQIHGQLSIRSKPEEGTTIRFTVPLRRR